MIANLLSKVVSQAPFPFNENHVFLWFFIMAVYGFSELGILIRNRRLAPKTRTQNKRLLQIVLPFFLAMFVSIFEALQFGHKWFSLLFVAGFVILIFGIVLRLVALIQIGKGFSIKVERSAEQTIIRKGTYRYIRHPLYLASILQTIGSVLMLCSKWAWIFFPFTIYGVMSRIRDEESFLQKEFKEYSDYQRKTWRLIPWVY
jgi:protein-S-isoprenylcysteine O-methyltransferase Ste14